MVDMEAEYQQFQHF
jgi:hypothetical protein